MSRDGYEGWDSPARGRDTDSGPRSHRRRGSGYGDDRRQADDEYGSDGYAGQSDYGSHRYGAAEGYGTDGYGADYQGGYGQAQHAADDGYAAQGYDGSGYANGNGGGYASDGYGGGYGEGQETYASRDPYATGDYGSADPYGGSDPRASGPHSLGDPYSRGGDPYDTGGGGYGSDGYGHGGQDPYAGPVGAGYERGGYGEQDNYLWRDPQDAGDDPGLTRRRRASREGEFDAEDPRHDGFFRGFGRDDDMGGRARSQTKSRPPKQRKSRAGLVALFIVLAIFAGVGYTGYHYYSLYKARHATYSGSGYGSALILVQPGDTLDGISSQLLDKHVIAAIDPWASYVANKSGLHPGKYRIHIHMSPAAAYAALVNPKNLINSKVTIPDGMRYSKILPLLAKESGIPLSQFETAIKDTAALGLPVYANGNPEGYLYPDTYDIAPGETALQILQAAVKQFNYEATTLHLTAAAQAVGFTPAKVITGASLLEAEVGPQYYGQVARVIDNRLNQGMNLGLDSTIAYATGHYIYALTESDLNFASPYNTRLHAGLPPGPIDSPDLAAIQAFLHPPHGTWLYFVTVDKKGTTEFTDSYSQFQIWSNQAKQNGV
jgi:UPF0755 protein